MAVVTGAARGLGRVISAMLADKGYALGLVDVADLTATAAELARTGVPVLTAAVDVSSEVGVKRFVREVYERFGHVEALVNNAGVSLLCPAEETSLEVWQRVVAVNLTGAFLFCREFGLKMLAAGAGSIVNVASIAGLRAVAQRVAYNASKHGMIGLTTTLAAEWGGRGVRVNAVCPGWIKTEMDAEDQASGGYSDRDITDQVPMGRFAAPVDVASAVAFLLDASSSFINGVALPVDGGWSSDASWTALRLRCRTTP